MKDVDAIVRSIFHEFFINFEDNDTFSSKGCDSLDAIELAMALEDELGLPELSDEQIVILSNTPIYKIINDLKLKEKS